MTIVFDGREFAKHKELGLKDKVTSLRDKGKIPKLVSIIVGTDAASVMYVNLKKKAAERIGCELLVVNCKQESSKKEIKEIIQKYNEENHVNGVMVQLPLPKNFPKEDRDEILNSIAPEKDVDGLREDSKFTAPTAKAVVEVLVEALKSKNKSVMETLEVAVVGASGMEGMRIVKALKSDERIKALVNKLQVVELNSKTNNLQLTTYDCDVIISVTGVPDLIKADMVKDGAVLIDVGAPSGDIEKKAYEKASFVSPVPGGVGPVTVNCLLENLVESA